MAITKKNALKQLNNMGSNVSNQQSLVKKLAGPQIQKPIRHVIPGGKHLTDSISQDQLPGTVWTWLRRVRHFKDAYVMLCSDYEKRNHRISTVVDFDANARLPEWETQGKKWLAERITEVLVMDNILLETRKACTLFRISTIPLTRVAMTGSLILYSHLINHLLSKGENYVFI